MTEENLNPVEEAEATPDEGGETEVAKLEERLKNMQKGIETLAAKVNQKEAKTETVKATASTLSPIIKNLYLKENPSFSEVEEEVTAEAQALGVDPIEYFESKKGWQLEAKARAEAKKVEEESKSKIGKPSNGTAPQKIDVSKVKDEDVKNLKPSEKLEWLKAQAEKERRA